MQCYSQNYAWEYLNERTIYKAANFHCFLKSLSPYLYFMFLGNSEILLPKYMYTYSRCQLKKTFKRISLSDDLSPYKNRWTQAHSSLDISFVNSKLIHLTLDLCLR